MLGGAGIGYRRLISSCVLRSYHGASIADRPSTVMSGEEQHAIRSQQDDVAVQRCGAWSTRESTSPTGSGLDKTSQKR